MKWLKPSLLVLAFVVMVPVAALILVETHLLPYKVFVVHTGSMTPDIPSKSAVIVEEHQYHVGQVISFKIHGEVVTHRLVAINPNGTITTKGDANRTADPWHPPTSNIIGSVVAAPHLVGFYLTYVKNPIGIVSIFLGLICLWLIFDLWFMAGQLDKNPADKALPSKS
ncbi:MAG TPA: signal peptidase I [Candidatus Saccharimonadales bacterium]|nr:signal peptidase I [Candidatus Saccharimonadales bacterium]